LWFTLITSWEWVLILLVVAALIIWGPQKIPELARSLGRARGEFEQASKEYSETSVKKTKTSGDDALLETAKKLGINTEGKTKEEISQEILEKFKKEASD